MKALRKSASDVGYDFRVLTSVMNVNDDQKTILFDPMKEHFGGSLEGIKVAMWGLAFNFSFVKRTTSTRGPFPLHD